MAGEALLVIGTIPVVICVAIVLYYGFKKPKQITHYCEHSYICQCKELPENA